MCLTICSGDSVTTHGPSQDVPLAPVRTNGKRILLASRSPRRRRLLADAGIDVTAEHPGFDDAVLESGRVSPREWVCSLAFLKAWGKAQQLESHHAADIIIGADTACVMDNRLIGTPASADEACEMIRQFRDRRHDVITGVAIFETATGRRRVFSQQATVWMGALSDQEIQTYVNSGDWAGKAGGYNLSERLEAGWPLRFEGEASTIMGLPIQLLAQELQAFLTEVPGTRIS